MPAPSGSPQNTVKNPFFDFLKVYNELGKVKKFLTSRPLFSWIYNRLKKVWAHCAPRTNRVKNLSFKQLVQVNINSYVYKRIKNCIPIFFSILVSKNELFLDTSFSKWYRKLNIESWLLHKLILCTMGAS